MSDDTSLQNSKSRSNQLTRFKEIWDCLDRAMTEEEVSRHLNYGSRSVVQDARRFRLLPRFMRQYLEEEVSRGVDDPIPSTIIRSLDRIRKKYRNYEPNDPPGELLSAWNDFVDEGRRAFRKKYEPIPRKDLDHARAIERLTKERDELKASLVQKTAECERLSATIEALQGCKQANV